MKLEKHELERYDRQIRIFGVEGQVKLKNTRVLVAGVGGLGSASALYLVAAGFGEVILVDKEKVELSNLNRQILHWTEDVGRHKVESAVEKLKRLNPHVKVKGLPESLNKENVFNLVSQVDLVVDGLDNWETRFLLNEACVKLNKPFIHAGVYGMCGQLMVVIPGKTPCLRCVVSTPPPETKPLPVLGVTPGLLAMLQVMEAIKIVTGCGEPLIGKMLVFNGEDSSFYQVEVGRRKNCPVCGVKKF